MSSIEFENLRRPDGIQSPSIDACSITKHQTSFIKVIYILQFIFTVFGGIGLVLSAIILSIAIHNNNKSLSDDGNNSNNDKRNKKREKNFEIGLLVYVIICAILSVFWLWYLHHVRKQECPKLWPSIVSCVFMICSFGGIGFI